MIDAVIVINVFLAHSVGSEEPVGSVRFDEENPLVSFSFACQTYGLS